MKEAPALRRGSIHDVCSPSILLEELIFLLNAVVFLFFMLGAIDYLWDGRLGLGRDFERGIKCCGQLMLVMVGFLSLSPVLGTILGPAVTPLFQALGADPSLLAGLFLSSDSGGAPLALALSLNRQAGSYNGYLVASMLGGAMMCIIPMSMLNTKESNRPAVIYGLVVGLFSVPFGCLAGGIIGGFSWELLLRNTAPVAGCSFLLIFLLVFFRERILRPFCAFSRLLIGVSLGGFALAALKELLGFAPLAGLEPFDGIMLIIGDIALMLGGLFPLMGLATRLMRKPIGCISSRWGMGHTEVNSILVTAVNPFPTLDQLNEMTPRGVFFNAAFMVCANCALGDHLAYTMKMAPELTAAVVMGKLFGGSVALLAAFVLAPRLLEGK